ncbi:hypothetical protein N9N67_06125 [Bacteriovoracaceae bacterium]|nr:hypothetical protein [Bacteriovoracaceae bacterium]
MNYFTISVLLLSFIFISCDDSRLYNQDFKKWNLDISKLSNEIKSKINPQSREKSLENSENIKIAVIDNGVDYNHTLLKNRFLEDNTGKLLGYDFASQDSLPYPSSLDISLFAFQEKFKKNQIHSDHSSDPLLDLKNYNEKILKDFHADPILRESSLYKNLFRHNTINIFGILYFYIYKKEILKLKSPDQKVNVKEILNLKLNFANFLKKSVYDEQAKAFLEHFDNNIYVALSFYYRLEQSNFNLSQTYGLPSIKTNHIESILDYFKHISIIQGYDQFIKRIDQITSSNVFKKFYQSFLNYHSFLNTKESFLEKDNIKLEDQQLSNNEFQSALSKSHQSLHDSFLRFHYKNKLIYSDGKFHDLTMEKRTFCLAVKGTRFHSKRKNQFKSKKITKSRQKIEKSLNLDFSQLSFFNSSDCNQLEEINQIPNYNAYILQSSKINSFDRGTAVSQLSTNGLDNKVKIIPLRIQTLNTFNGIVQNEESVDKHILKFKNFVQQRPNIKEFILHYSNNDLDRSLSFLRRRLLNKKYVTGINIFNSLIETFNFILKQNIKIVLIPFATHFQNIRLEDNNDPIESMESVVFLTFIEFLKFEIRARINKLGEDTLIFVSAGNQGKLIDGTNDTVIPCDLSSSKFLDDLGVMDFESSPRNIICVESLSEKRSFNQKEYYPSSSFTNKILSKINVIKVKGEQINAAISASNCSDVLHHFSFSPEARMNEYDKLLMKILVLEHKEYFCNIDLRTKMKLNNGSDYATALAVNYFLRKYITQNEDKSLLDFKHFFLEPFNKCVKTQENDFCEDELIIDLNE